MTKRFQITVIFAILALAVAAAAVADVASLEQRTSVLLQDQADVEARIDACPDGTCVDAVGIRADVDALHQELQSIQNERATLNPCPNCGNLDTMIGQANVNDVRIAGRILAWEESS